MTTNRGLVTMSYRIEGWQVSIDVERAESRVSILGLRMAPVESVPAPGITAGLLRRLNLGAWRHHLRGNATARSAPTKNPERGRPRTIPIAFYQRVYQRYHALLRSGTPNAAKVLAAEEKMKRSTMRSTIRRAKRLLAQRVKAGPVTVTLSRKQDSARRSAHRR